MVPTPICFHLILKEYYQASFFRQKWVHFAPLSFSLIPNFFMSTPFLGEIKMVSFPFAPKGWALANGQLLPLNQNQALFSLYGTTYGGNGSTTFGLPDLRGRSAMHFNGTYPLGQRAGEETHSLITNEIPGHSHTANVSTGGLQHSPASNTLPGVNGLSFYDASATVNSTMAGGVIGNAGGGQGHENRMPFLTLNFIVALQGIFPSRN